MIEDKFPPFSQESEEALLASLMVDSDMMDDVHIIVNQKYFFSESC